MYNLLICDDEPDIVRALRIYLSSEGYGIFEASNGGQAIEIVEKHPIHLILMDIMMPVMDGMDATERLRRDYNMPIILLTAKGEESDKVLGLNIGADDYITKPFSPIEVIARVKSQLRRYTRLGGIETPEESSSIIRIGGVELDDDAKCVRVDGEPAALTPLEFSILKLLMSNAGRVFSSTQIYEKIWNDASYGSEATVAVHIRHIREKIEINPADPRYLKVVWGLGYKFEKLKG